MKYDTFLQLLSMTVSHDELKKCILGLVTQVGDKLEKLRADCDRLKVLYLKSLVLSEVTITLENLQFDYDLIKAYHYRTNGQFSYCANPDLVDQRIELIEMCSQCTLLIQMCSQNISLTIKEGDHLSVGGGRVVKAIVVSAVILLSLVYLYLIGYIDRGGSKAGSSGSLDFRDIYISIVLFQAAYVWIKFRDVIPDVIADVIADDIPDVIPDDIPLYKRPNSNRLEPRLRFPVSVGGRPVGGRPVGGRPVGGRPVGGRPVGGRPVGGRPVGGRPVGGRPVGGRPVGGRPVGGESKRIRLGSYGTRAEAEYVYQIAAFYCEKPEYLLGQLKLGGGACYLIPPLSVDRNLPYDEQVIQVGKRVLRVYAEFKEWKASQNLPPHVPRPALEMPTGEGEVLTTSLIQQPQGQPAPNIHNGVDSNNPSSAVLAKIQHELLEVIDSLKAQLSQEKDEHNELKRRHSELEGLLEQLWLPEPNFDPDTFFDGIEI